MNLMELLGGMGKCDEVREIENLANNIWRRNKWAKLSALQRVRIELGAAAGKAVECNLHMNPVGTLAFWLSDSDVFDGVTFDEKKGDDGRTFLHVTDGKEEFLVRDEGDGLNISGVKPIGKASLVDEEEIAAERANQRVQ